jgi:outer membrane receptor protein involved in Fe transport
VERFVGTWLALTIGTVIGVLAAPAARAQAPAAPETVYRADEIVVEDARDATRNTEVFEDTPIQREVLPRQELERRPGTSAADLVRTIPGVRQQQRVQGEEAAVSIEGLPPEFTRALVDGERYTGEIGAVDDFRTIPIADAERVEVLRGAQALRYGSDAAGGVVRIDTPDPPRDGLRGWFEAGYGGDEWGYGAGSLGYGGERAGGWLRFVNDQIDGFGAPNDLDDAVRVSAGPQSQRIARDLYGKLRLDPHERIGLVTRFGWRSDDESGLSGESGVGDREEERWLAGQHGTWQLGEATRLVGAFNWYDTELTSDVGRAFELVEREPSGRLALEHLLETGPVVHALTVGFDAFAPLLELEESAFTRTDTDVPVTFPASDLDERQRLGGIYAITESELTRWLALEGGLRAQFHGDYEPELLPQVAVLLRPWQPDEQRFLRLRASWGRGYRTPSLRDLYQPPVAQLGGAYFLAGSPDLEPEHVESFRLGLEAAPVTRVSVAVTAFWNEIEDNIRSTLCRDSRICDPDGTIVTGFRQIPGFPPIPVRAPVFVKTNLAQVETRGVEARLRLRPHRRVDLEVAYTWLETEVEDETITITELPNEPEHVVDGLVGIELPWTGTRLAALARWRGEALTETSGTGLVSFASLEESDPSLVVDLRLVQPLGSTDFELYADLFNATDERVVDSNVVRGRTWFVGLRGRF